MQMGPADLHTAATGAEGLGMSLICVMTQFLETVVILRTACEVTHRQHISTGSSYRAELRFPAAPVLMHAHAPVLSDST